MKLLAVLKRSERQLKVGAQWSMGNVPYLPLSVHWLLWYLRQSRNDEISMILVMSKFEVKEPSSEDLPTNLELDSPG